MALNPVGTYTLKREVAHYEKRTETCPVCEGSGRWVAVKSELPDRHAPVNPSPETRPCWRCSGIKTVTSQARIVDGHERVSFELSADLEAIATRLGYAAAVNRRGRSTALSGKITARVLGREPVAP